MRLKNKIAIVTGAGSGFGRGIATRFAEEGAQVVATDINLNTAQDTADSITSAGGASFAVQCDVSDSDSTAAMIKATIERYGGLDVLVQNAAIGQRPQALVDTPEDIFDELFRINVRSVYLGARHAVPVMIKQGRGGAIVNIVSTAAIRPRPYLAAYNATKGALVPMSKALALEVAEHKIRVNGICPVAGDTAMLSDYFLGDGDPDEARKRFVATVPLGRLSTPEDIAAAAVYLASDEAALVTGVMLEIDGGRCV